MLNLSFDTGNAAFAESGPYEAARILRDIAARIENGKRSGKVFDLNGNSIGQWSVVFEESGE